MDTNNLTVFSKEIIPVYTTGTGERVVIGRELHEKLKIDTPYNKWFPRMCEYGFFEEEDFQTFLSESTGGRPAENHTLKLEMAKHVAMIQRSPEGKAIRDQLIALETNVSELSPELRLLINMELKQKEQAKAIEAVNQRVDDIREVVALNPIQWREESQFMVASVAKQLGGIEHIRDIHSEIYNLVDSRAGCSLKRRLENLKSRMAMEGASKSKIRTLNKLDVIAQDKKLIEIYVAIVKEMAVKYDAIGSINREEQNV